MREAKGLQVLMGAVGGAGALCCCSRTAFGFETDPEITTGGLVSASTLFGIGTILEYIGALRKLILVQHHYYSPFPKYQKDASILKMSIFLPIGPTTCFPVSSFLFFHELTALSCTPLWCFCYTTHASTVLLILKLLSLLVSIPSVLDVSQPQLRQSWQSWQSWWPGFRRSQGLQEKMPSDGWTKNCTQYMCI